MGEEYLAKLNQIRKYLGVGEEDYTDILAYAERYRNHSTVSISDEMLFQIVSEALLSIDFPDVVLENKERLIELNQQINKEDYVGIKTPREAVEHAVKSLGY